MGGVSAREGHTEATIELSRLAGFTPGGVLCEVLRDDGEVARLPDLIKFSKKFKVKIVAMSDLIDYVGINPKPRRERKSIVVKKSTSCLPTQYGTFQITIYRSLTDNREHAVLVLGGKKKKPFLVRIHSQCFTGDTLLGLKCDCRDQLHQSMKMIRKNKQGVIIYLAQEGRGIGLSNKIKAYALQDKGLDTVEANCELGFPPDARDYKVAVEILHDLKISDITLLTNNPQKIYQLSNYGINVVKRLPLEVTPTSANHRYLFAKKRKLGHHLQLL